MTAKPNVDIQRRYADRPDLDRQVEALLALLRHNEKPAVVAAGEGDQGTDVSLTRR